MMVMNWVCSVLLIAVFSFDVTNKITSASSSQLARIIRSPLPVLYVYDHCPFCVRVRLALGLKNVKHEVRFLANDDKATPTALVGKKVVPIFDSGDGKPQGESLDIIARVDSDISFGPTGLFKPFTNRADLKEWQSKIANVNRLLQRPRYMKASILPEFQQSDGRDAFVFNHPIPPYEKDEWKATMTLQQMWEKYEEAFKGSDSLIAEANGFLHELNELLHCSEHCSDIGLSMDDIDLWSRLRSMTMVKGLIWPEKVKQYMETLSHRGDIPLYFQVEC